MKRPFKTISAIRQFSVLLLLAALTSCASMGELATKLAPTDPDTLYTTTDSAKEPAVLPQQWWKVFNDHQLDALMAEALSNNPKLAIAEARIRQAQAFAVQADANRTPIISSFAAAQGMYIPETLIDEPEGGNYMSLKLLGVNAAYHLDLWGGDRSAWEAALGRQNAAKIDAIAAQLTVSTLLTRTYNALGYAYITKDLAVSDLQRANHQLDLIHQRVTAGIDAQQILNQAQSSVIMAQQQVIAADRTIEHLQISLAIITGKGPDKASEIKRPVIANYDTLTLPSEIPADLVGRRPDIIAAKLRVQAANRDIDSAKARFYPSFNLTAAAGLGALHTSDLLSLQSRFYTVMPALSLPIFSGNRLRADLAQSNAGYDLAVARYNETLVTAFNKVADNLKNIASLEAREEAQIRAVENAQQSLHMASQRFDQGIGNFLDVLNSKQTLLAAERILTHIHLQQVNSSIQLINALGGGFKAAHLAALQGQG